MNTITPIDIVDRPVDPYRIIPILEEFRKIWEKHPKDTFCQIISRISEKEYSRDYAIYMTDDELIAAIQNYNV